MSAQPTVLVVDDERELADLYAMWVGEDYEVVTAYDGRSAIERVNDSIDAVLLDRHMPDITGDRVLEEIRAAGYDCWVIMVTAVDPGLDIVELDIDDYVT
ncbi:response regulator transcription factor [Natrinema caseinilyticum]|uniref:response regulator transcription factor n=1 Tax=Natrinema caseinilyticum TaxID=2961570 RepID=UPI0020C4F346|nr:response regulator [Natrinema caseinilyticum]